MCNNPFYKKNHLSNTYFFFFPFLFQSFFFIMKFQLLTLALFAVAANAAEIRSAGAESSVIIPVPPPGVICPMVVCTPSTLAKRAEDIVCPTYCTNGCKIIDDICCPGNKKPVCTNDGGSSASGSISATALVPTAVPTAISSSNSALSSAISSAVSSAISQATSSIAPTVPVSSATVVPAAASPTSGSETLTIMSSCMVLTLIAIGLNQL